MVDSTLLTGTASDQYHCAIPFELFVMPSFKRVHGDYTLDDPLDPELEAYQGHLNTYTAERLSEKQSKKRRISVALSDSDEEPSHSTKHQQSASFSGNYEDRTASAGLNDVGVVDETHGADQVHPEESPASPAQRLTLKSLELFVVNDAGTFYWDPQQQKLVNSRVRPGHMTHWLSLRQLGWTLALMSLFTASKQVESDLRRVVPTVFADYLIHEAGIDYYTYALKKYLVHDCARDALDILKSRRIWPPHDAGFEVRRQFWKLCFCREVVECVFGGKAHCYSKCWSGISFDTIISSSESYLPRRWLWHLFVILMEISFKFDPSNPKQRQLRSGKIREPGPSPGASLPSHNGPARICLGRITWEETIENFEDDVLATWDHRPIDISEIDCAEHFGAPKLSRESPFECLENFATKLRDRPPESLPPLLAEHFQKCSPGDPVRHRLYSLATEHMHDEIDIQRNPNRGARNPNRGARIRTAIPPPASIVTSEALGEPSVPKSRRNKASTSTMSSGKPPVVATRTAPDETIVAVEKSGSRRVATNLQSSDVIESQRMANTEGPRTDSEPGESSDEQILPTVLGAWDDDWEPEEQSFADISKAAYSWWARGRVGSCRK